MLRQNEVFEPRELTINKWQATNMQDDLDKIKTTLQGPFFQHESGEKNQLLQQRDYLEQALIDAKQYLAQVERYHIAINTLAKKIKEERSKVSVNHTTPIVDVLGILEKFGLSAMNEYQSIAALNSNLKAIVSNERLQDLTDGIELLTNQLNVITAPTLNMNALNQNQEKIGDLYTKLEKTKRRNKYNAAALYAANLALYAAAGIIFLGGAMLNMTGFIGGLTCGILAGGPIASIAVGIPAMAIGVIAPTLVSATLALLAMSKADDYRQRGREALDRSTHHRQAEHMRFFNHAVKRGFNREGVESKLTDAISGQRRFSYSAC